MKNMFHYITQCDMSYKRDHDRESYFHVCTDGNAIPWMFQDDDDFIAGVNRIGLCVLKTYVDVIAFILMDNHVHFVLYGTSLKCKQFINYYKMLTGKWLHNKYGLKDYLRLLPTEMIPIADEDSLLNTLAYIDRNSIVAGYKYLPYEYPWGSARYMFRDRAGCAAKDMLKALGELSHSEQIILLKTKLRLPGEWLIDARGMIHPISFMDFTNMEKIFRTSSRYAYYMAKKLEGHVEMQLAQSRKVFIPDKELRQIAKKISARQFGTENILSLDVNSRLVLAKYLRYDYASTVKQISRMVRLDDEMLKGFL